MGRAHCRGIAGRIAGRPAPSGCTGRFAPNSTRARLIDWAVAGGRGVALPVVVDKKGPLEYRAWRPGEALVDGVWNIPVPEKRDIVIPSVVLAPLVGFDRAGYRLGYGGGYFDRTLAALSPRPRAIGVGFALQAIDNHPSPGFDIPMDVDRYRNGVHRR